MLAAGGHAAHAAEPARISPSSIITGEASYHAPYDHCTSKYLAQAGVPNEHIRLEARGIRGNGHGIPSEKNNLVSAKLVDDWLRAKVR